MTIVVAGNRQEYQQYLKDTGADPRETIYYIPG
jgi:hypothetical protein